ncbi:alanine racemase [Patescibacteria group bacterium]|nr:alanine racemase [Patescibacteria group bacterium]MBU1705327.1 alanine racemase [Patescibacteria group bacterium]
MAKHRTWVEISEEALQNNIYELRALLRPETEFAAVVKSNAYGHSLEQVVPMMSKVAVKRFAVDNINEALLVRELAPEASINVIGYIMHEQLAEAIEAGIELTVYDKDTIRLVEEIARQRKQIVSIHLKLDTGMSRQGVLPQNLSDVVTLLLDCPHLTVAGVSTHFANLDNYRDPSFTLMQCELYEQCIEQIELAGFHPQFLHCAKSSAIILYPNTQGTLVRAGIALYGIWPTPDIQDEARRQSIKCSLKPVLSWKTRVIQVKSLPTGTPISYDLTEALRKPSRIAVLPIGYYDNFDRKLSSIGEVLIKGYRCKVLGRVCMNMTMVDVSSVPDVKPEQEAIIIGASGRHQITAQEIADKIGTIPYEVVSRISPTIPRVAVE